jgi:hypothetical protein
MKWWLNVIGIEMLSVTYLGNVVNPETAELGKESMMRAAAIAKDHFGPDIIVSFVSLPVFINGD